MDFQDKYSSCYFLSNKHFHCLVAFNSWNIGQYVYFNCLLSGCDVINFEINLLLVPIQQWKHQNNVENQFTFNNKNQWLRFGVWPNFIRCSVSIVDFEQINDGWFFPFLASTVRADSKWYFLFPKWSFFEKATLRFTRYVFPTRYNYHCDALRNLLPFLQF